MVNDSIDNIRLDLNRPKVRASLSVRKGDTKTRTIHVALASNGAVFDLSNCAFAELIIKKPDGNICDQNMVIVDNELQYTFRTQDTNVIGECVCQVQLTFKDGSVVNTPEFFMYVYSASIDSKVIESMNEYTAISQMAVESLQAAEESKKSKEDAAFSAFAAEDAARTAEQHVAVTEANREEVAENLIKYEQLTGETERNALDAKEYAENARYILDDIEDAEHQVYNYMSQAAAAADVAQKSESIIEESKLVVKDAEEAAKNYALDASRESNSASNSASVALAESSKAERQAIAAENSALLAESKVTAAMWHAEQALNANTSANASASAAKASAQRAEIAAQKIEEVTKLLITVDGTNLKFNGTSSTAKVEGTTLVF